MQFERVSTYVLLWTLFACVAGITEAQPLNFERHMVDESSDTWIAFDLADFDGDGDFDLLIADGARGGPLLWYENDGSGMGWTRHLLAEKGPGGGVFTTGDIETADFDRDGDTDLIAFEHPGAWGENAQGKSLNDYPASIYWYENEEGGKEWTPHEVGEMTSYVKDVELEDYDGDGRVDLAATTYGPFHTFALFRQLDGGRFERVQHFSIPGLHEGMDSGDLDGDGDLDVAANGYWIENPGGNLTDIWTVRPIDARWFTQGGDWRQNATKVVVADVDGDGRGEVIMSHSEQSGYPVVWYDATNPKAADGWEMHVIAKGLNAAHSLQAADFDNDGDIDILAGENGDSNTAEIVDDGAKQVRIFLNGGDGMEWTPVAFSETGLYNGIVADFDGDGRLDVAGPAGHEADPYTIYLSK